jgi:hypothetical protein
MTEVREIDAQISDCGEASDEFLSHTVGQVVLAGVAGKIRQRQHGKRLNRSLFCGAATIHSYGD